MAPLLYYKNPVAPHDWVPFGTSDPVANEVQVIPSVPPTDELTELWVDPLGSGTDADWTQLDARYINTDGDTMTGPLNVVTPTANTHAVTKQYVDTATMMATNAANATRPPIGSIIMFAGKRVPRGWHKCDGTVHGSWALEQELGSPNTPLIPSSQNFGYIIFGGG